MISKKHKHVRDLKRGDKVKLEGGTGTILMCKRFPIVDCADGPAYEVAWRDDVGATGIAIASANDRVEIVLGGPPKDH